MMGIEDRTNLSHVARKFFRGCHVECPGTWQIDGEHVDDRARSRAHDRNPRPQENGFRYRMGNEHDRLADIAPDVFEFGVHDLARHRVEGAERFVHQHQSWLINQRAADRNSLLHPA